jgi:hypothetical protein
MYAGANEDLALAGQYVYVAQSYDYLAGGVNVISVWDPSYPRLVGSCDFEGVAEGISLQDTLACVASGDQVLTIISIADPENPRVIGNCSFDDYATDVTVRDDFAYLTGLYGGLHVISIADPSAPFRVGMSYSPHYPRRLELSGDYAYVAEERRRVSVIDIGNPQHPEELGYYETPMAATDISVSGSYAFATTAGMGLYVFEYFVTTGITDPEGDVRPPLGYSLSQNYPNPFNPVTTIEVEIPWGKEAGITLSVYDIRGRLVRVLVDGPAIPGKLRVLWDGRDNVGGKVASGAYFFTLKTAESVHTRKVVLLH